MQPPDLVPNLPRIEADLTDLEGLTPLDRELLTILARGRCTRGYLASTIADEQASWIGKRLATLVDEGVLERPARGLYELPWELRERGDVLVVVEPDETARKIREHLSTRHDLVPEQYRREGENPLSSLCYVASEAYYYAMGKPNELTPQRIEWPDGSSHWFLATDAYVIDLSLPEPDPWLPVDDAEGRMFPSHPYPSNRTKDVLERLDLAPKVVADD